VRAEFGWLCCWAPWRSARVPAISRRPRPSPSQPPVPPGVSDGDAHRAPAMSGRGPVRGAPVRTSGPAGRSPAVR